MMRIFIATLAGLSLAIATLSAEDYVKTSPYTTSMKGASATEFQFGLGYLNVSAQEAVFGGPGNVDGLRNLLSHLTWETDTALTVDLGVTHELNDRLSVFAEGRIGITDDSYMEDLDWLTSRSAYSDRSQHPGTELDHFFQIDGGIDYNLVRKENLDLSARLGLRYTDISWDALGGSYVYSEGGGFRNDRGTSPVDELGISYRQKLPAVYAGPQAAWHLSNRATFTAGAHAGLTFAAEDEDNHWLTDTHYLGDFDSEVHWGGNLGLDVQWSEKLMLHFGMAYENYEFMKGSTTITDTTNGDSEVDGGDSVGAALELFRFNVGVKFGF